MANPTFVHFLKWPNGGAEQRNKMNTFKQAFLRLNFSFFKIIFQL